MTTLITAYRVMSMIVGTVLVIFILIAMPQKYLLDQPLGVEVISPIHGFLYAVFALIVIMLGFSDRWSLGRMVLILLAGTVPFVSFYAEHRTVEFLRAEGRLAPAGGRSGAENVDRSGDHEGRQPE
ncbi:MAG: DUF3817 domain-containing protein [Actinomycetales bacterium]|nr:DUF3817 domain-containing protein [Actinomycetales bacterium]